MYKNKRRLIVPDLTAANTRAGRRPNHCAFSALSAQDAPTGKRCPAPPRLARIPSLLMGLGLLSASPAFAASVVNEFPTNAAHDADPETFIQAEFLFNVTSASPMSVLARSTQTDLSDSELLVAIPPLNLKAVRLNPGSTFFPGEVVQAIVTDGVTTVTASSIPGTGSPGPTRTRMTLAFAAWRMRASAST